MTDNETRDNELAVIQKANEIRRNELLNSARQTNEQSKGALREIDECLAEKGILVNGTSISRDEKQESLSLDAKPLRGKPREATEFAPVDPHDWKHKVEESREILIDRGYNPDSLSTYSFISSEKLREIDAYLNRPIYDRIPWENSDYILSTLAGVLGGVLDAVLCTPEKVLKGKMKGVNSINSWIEKKLEIDKKLENIHSWHDTFGGSRYYAPIDHQTSGVSGGAYHRGLSPGHDLMYFVEAIRQFRDGQFRTIGWKDGVAHIYQSKFVSPIGANEYIPLPLEKAIVAYAVHMFCDFFSSTSLPLPGTYFFRQSPDRAVRQLTQMVYKEGINLRYVTFQTLPPVLIFLFISVCCWFKHHGITDCEEALKQKKLEMTCLALGISSAMNLGKACLKCQGEPLTMAFYLNYPQLAYFAKSILHLVILESRRNDYAAKVSRNVNDLILKNEEIMGIVRARMSAKYDIYDDGIKLAS